MTESITSWREAPKAPFEAFGILYYPLFRNHADLPTTLDDVDMAWAVTANTNLEGTGYTLSQPSILTLAACHHALADLAHGTALLSLAGVAEVAINPLADLKRLVPDVTAAPMYPDFPSQVMEISEAQFRYDQACHYFSTYGVELIAGLLGYDVTVSEGWLPQVESTPKTEEDEALVAPKVLHLLATVEDLQSVVSDRLARATRMHPAEIETTLLVFDSLGDEVGASVFPKVAFHENMMELIRIASEGDSATLEHVAAGLAQHPGDLLKATRHLLETAPKNHLSTRQKKGLCQAFEHFGTRAIARNIADAGRKDRLAPNFLSVSRFGGPHLREAVELVESGEVRSWASELELLWTKVLKLKLPNREGLWQQLIAGHSKHPSASLREQFNALYESLYGDQPPSLEGWQKLLAHYGQRPGILLRSLGRLLKAGCPKELIVAEAFDHVESFALPTLVSTLTALSNDFQESVNPLSGTAQRRTRKGGGAKGSGKEMDPTTRKQLVSVLRQLAELRMGSLETPLMGKRVYLDTAGISLVGSVLRPNETGNTGTAWPPVGIAYDLPTDKVLRFFTFWDDRERRVDVDLHFMGRKVSGDRVHIGWNAVFRMDGMITSGDITTSENSVEYLDIDMAEARKAGVAFVVQNQHIFTGRPSWDQIQTCYSGALAVSKLGRDVRLYNGENLLFRDDLTGEGRRMDYAAINVPNHYVRILRGTNLPYGDLAYSLGDYLNALFRAQNVTLVETPEEAELCVCVGRSSDPQVISLFDEGFYIG